MARLVVVLATAIAVVQAGDSGRAFCKAKDLAEELGTDVLDRQLDYLWYELYRGVPAAVNSINQDNLDSNRMTWSSLLIDVVGLLILTFASVRIKA